MKTIPFLFILSALFLAPMNSDAQVRNKESLSKYSYPIFTVSGKQQHTGTAFFYKQGDTSFLVSNYHAIKGMNPLQQNINFQADSLYLKYPVKNSDETKMITLDISDEVTGKTEIFSMVTRIDLMKIAVELPEDADIHYINELIDTELMEVEPEEVVVYGYPTGSGSIPAFYSQQHKLEGNVNSNGFADYDASLRVNFPDASDSARAILHGTSRYYYFIRPFAAQGYSGAPVFGKFRNANNKPIYRFIGVIFAGQPATRQTWAIKGKVALEYLQGEIFE
jgi:hypothetical protein